MGHIYSKKCKKSFKYLAGLTIATSINTVAYAASYEPPKSVANENMEYCQVDANSVASQLTDSLQKHKFVNHIKTMDTGCISKLTLASPNELEIIISKQNMLDIADAAYAIVKNTLDIPDAAYTETNSKALLNLATFLNTGFFLQSQNSYYIPDYSENKDNHLKSKVAAIAHAYALKIFKKKPNATLKEVSKQVFGLINSAKSFEESLSLIEYITENSKSISNKAHPLYESILPIQRALAASHDAGGIYFKLNNKSGNSKQNNLSSDIEVKSDKIVKNIIKIVNEEKNTLDEVLYRNYIRELGKFLRYQHHREEVTKALSNVIKNTTRNAGKDKKDPTPFWVEAVAALEDNKIVNANNCKEFTDASGVNVCDAKSSLSNDLFPNRVKYDEGNIVIFSSLDAHEAEKQYLAMKTVEALFKRTIQTIKPIANDPNERLQVYIYKSFEEYMKYKSYISDLSNKEDGGIYLENIGSFYTYAGDDLENRVRHEFAHFLNGRYLVKGIHGDTSSFDKKWSRMTWFEEGTAEFFAGATQTDGFVKRKNIDLNNIRPIKEITNSSYGTLPSKVLYNQSYALVSYLYYKQPEMFKNILNSIKNNNVKEFDNLINTLSSNSSINTNYIKYIKEELAKSPDLTEATIADVTTNTFQAYETDSIKKQMENAGLTISKCEVVASSEFGNAQARFGCSGSAQGTINENDANLKLNKALKKLVATDRQNRFIYTNCMFGDGTFYCEGPLQSASFDQLSPQRQNKVKVSNNEQRTKTFKGTTEHFYFFTGNTLSEALFTSQRRQEGQGYNYNQNKNPASGNLNTNKNGEITYTNTGTAEDDYKKVTAQIGITEKEKIPLDNDNPHNVNVNIFKFKEIDERMFKDDIYLNDRNYNPGTMLYRDEYSMNPNNKDGFQVFTDEFRRQSVNDLDFEIIDQPKTARSEIYNRYMIKYSNPNKVKGHDDLIKVRVRKHNNQNTEIITIRIKDKEQEPVNPLVSEAIKNKDLKTHTITINAYNGTSNGYIYDQIEHMLESGFHYNYKVIENSKCNKEFILEKYGGYSYQVTDKSCKVGTKDKILILVTKVTNNDLTPIMKIDVTFKIN
jgi:Collagenase/Peptidase family M9 N-terminal